MPKTPQRRKPSQHKELHWIDCSQKGCRHHARAREASRYGGDDCCHSHLEPQECMIEKCYVHEPEKEELAHQRLCWINCTSNCNFHQEQRRDARQVDNFYHSTLTPDECGSKECWMHLGYDQVTSQKPRPQLKEVTDNTPIGIPHQNIH